MSRLRECFAPHWLSIQTALFPWLEEELGPLTEKQQQFVQTLEVIRVEDHIPRRVRMPGRPRKDRAAVARAFVAKAVYDLPRVEPRRPSQIESEIPDRGRLHNGSVDSGYYATMVPIQSVVLTRLR